MEYAVRVTNWVLGLAIGGLVVATFTPHAASTTAPTVSVGTVTSMTTSDARTPAPEPAQSGGTTVSFTVTDAPAPFTWMPLPERNTE